MSTWWICSVCLLLTGSRLVAQQKLLTDDDARKIATKTVHDVYPQECYSTYRKEGLEDWVLSERRNRLENGELKRAVYVYRVAFDSCYYVVTENGKTELRTVVIDHEQDYGYVAVDRATGSTYWFRREGEAERVFQRFVKEQELVLKKDAPLLFFALYRALVWGDNDAHEVTGISHLRTLVESNFQSAYSPYERDEKWSGKFDVWWRKFRSRQPRIELSTTSEQSADGVLIHGYSFKGFELTVPRSDPPPKGTPTLARWSLLLRADGTARTLPSTIVYAGR